MRIAVSTTTAYDKVTGHAGRARRWLVFTVSEAGEVAQPERVELAAPQVFHHFDFAAGEPHPLAGITALITQSAGEGFLDKMRRQGIDARLTAETDPAGAVASHLAGTLTPPRPRPVGELVCKAIDRLTRPRRS